MRKLFPLFFSTKLRKQFPPPEQTNPLTISMALDLICQHAQHNINEDDREILYQQICTSAQEGYFLKFEEKDSWNISFTFQYNKQYYGVALYGKNANKRNLHNLMEQAKHLNSDIRESLGVF